jgi:hypothetical protein
VPIPANPDGKRQAGLRNAWELAAHHLGGEVADFVAAERSRSAGRAEKARAPTAEGAAMG